jgi:hypothetical protein
MGRWDNGGKEASSWGQSRRKGMLNNEESQLSMFGKERKDIHFITWSDIYFREFKPL